MIARAGQLKGVWRRRSLRFRLTLLVVLITFIGLLGIALLAGHTLAPFLTKAVEGELRGLVDRASAEVVHGRLPADPPGIEVRVLDTAGTPVDGREPTVLDAGAVRTLKAGLPAETRVGGGPPVRWLGTVVSAPDGSQRLVVAGVAELDAAAVDQGSRWLIWVAVGGTVVAGLEIWLVVHFALRPVARMRRSVRALPSWQRLPLPQSHDELRALAEEFNALLARQEEVHQRLRRFTGDAAHELRSPVASIRVQAEVAVANPDPSLAQETLADILAEAERLSSLLDGLLTLARSDAAELPPGEPVELVTEARAAIARLPDGSVPARVSGTAGEAWAYATPAEVELVLNNLLRNAARYASSEIVVSVLAGRSTVSVVVDDDGPGIAPEHRKKVFDRFYRIGDDRARSSGGTGLGLAMVAETVRRRGGKARVGESPEGGCRIQITWPAAPN